MRSKHAVVLFALLLFPALALAQSPTTESGDVTATIQPIALTLESTAPLDFGTVAPFGRPGVAAVREDGSMGADNAYFVSPGSPARWTVSGAPNAVVAVVLPADGEVVVTDGASSMPVAGFHRSNQGFPFILSASGFGLFTVGAHINVAANQPAGVYSGTYNVTVYYN